MGDMLPRTLPTIPASCITPSKCFGCSILVRSCVVFFAIPIVTILFAFAVDIAGEVLTEDNVVRDLGKAFAILDLIFPLDLLSSEALNPKVPLSSTTTLLEVMIFPFPFGNLP